MRTRALPLSGLTRPAPGCAEVWLARLDDFHLPGLAVPQTRREAVRETRVRRRFLLRLILGGYLGRPGKDLRLTAGPAGKPQLADNELAFSLSHGGGWLAIAVAGGGEVGIDLEVGRVLPRAGRLARRWFSAAEARRVEALDEPGRSRECLRRWTAREALIKAAGGTIAAHLSAIELTEDDLAVKSLPSTWPAPGKWSLRELEAGPDRFVHLAAPAVIEKVVLTRLLPPQPARNPQPAESKPD